MTPIYSSDQWPIRKRFVIISACWTHLDSFVFLIIFNCYLYVSYSFIHQQLQAASSLFCFFFTHSKQTKIIYLDKQFNWIELTVLILCDVWQKQTNDIFSPFSFIFVLSPYLIPIDLRGQLMIFVVLQKHLLKCVLCCYIWKKRTKERYVSRRLIVQSCIQVPNLPWSVTRLKGLGTKWGVYWLQ